MSVVIRDCHIGEGRPKVIIPIVEASESKILERALEFSELYIDCVEWRVDWFEQCNDVHSVVSCLQKIRVALKDKLLLVTLRTKTEGGEVSLTHQEYLDFRAEWVDMTEIVRRITLGIYDHDEFDKALSWVKANCKEGFDCNAGKDLPEIIRKSKVVDPDKDWAFITKMTIIMRDILYGNPKLDEMGWHEEALGKNAIAGGFQGQRNWTDWLPNADFTEAIMASSFDWNGKKAPTPFATENDTLNGVAMMLGTLVSGTAPCFHDVRTYWSPEACQRVTGMAPTGVAKDGFIHLINSGATALDGTGACRNAKGEPCMKPFWEMTDADIKACLNATDWCRANYEYFRGGGFSSHFRCRAEMPVTMLRVNVIDGIGPVLQLAEGYTADLPQ